MFLLEEQGSHLETWGGHIPIPTGHIGGYRPQLSEIIQDL